MARDLAGVTVFITLLALFQHANVRLRFPVVALGHQHTGVAPLHHAIDDEARDKNFGLPIIRRDVRTAYLPKGRRRRPSGP